MDINLGVSTWSKLLREVVNWFQSAHQHSFLVEFFKKAGKVYEMRKESLQFVTDLLKLRVRDLLSCESLHRPCPYIIIIVSLTSTFMQEASCSIQCCYTATILPCM